MTREERNNKLKQMNKEEIIQGLYRGDSRAIKEAIKALEQKPCEDAISREEVKELFQEGSVMGMYYFLGIDELPSVTLARKKGKWIVLKDEHGDICEAICSCCEDNGNHRWKYCPTCGAEMESE